MDLRSSLKDGSDYKLWLAKDAKEDRKVRKLQYEPLRTVKIPDLVRCPNVVRSERSLKVHSDIMFFGKQRDKHGEGGLNAVISMASVSRAKRGTAVGQSGTDGMPNSECGMRNTQCGRQEKGDHRYETRD